LSLFLLVLKSLFWIPAEFANKGRSLLFLEASFPGLSVAVVSGASFRYLSRTIVARCFLGVPCFVGGGAFLAYLSLVLYYSEMPIYSIILKIVTFLE
jgi:hypothetical protein